MTDYKQVIVYKFGFEFDNKLFCWKNKELFKMAYSNNRRSYSTRKLKLQHNGGSYGYWICGLFKSLTNLKEITKEINYSIEIMVDNGLPF